MTQKQRQLEMLAEAERGYICMNETIPDWIEDLRRKVLNDEEVEVPVDWTIKPYVRIIKYKER